MLLAFCRLKYNDSRVVPVSDADMTKVFSGSVGAQSSSEISGSGAGSLDSDSKETIIKDTLLTSDSPTVQDDLATPYVYIYRRMDEEQ